MIRKFARVSVVQNVLSAVLITILAGAATVHAQQTPAQPPAQPPQTQPQPDSQQSSSSSQEASTEEIGPRRKKPKEFKKWVFNAGGGASLVNGNTKNFVRGGGGIGAAGVARNYSEYFGFRADFQFDNLPLRSSALQAAQAPGATSHVYTFTLDPIINITATKVWGGYVLFGPAYFHRSGSLDSSGAVPGSACNSFFTWWGACFNGSLPVNGKFLNASQNEFGYNFGGGVTRKISPKMEVYAEFRYLHGSHSGITTDLRPITVGIRW